MSATGPSVLTSVAASAGPTKVPAVPPAAMNPNSRRPCALLKQSASTLQKMLMTNRLKTLIQTKNTRPTHTLFRSIAISTQNTRMLAVKKR